MNINDGLKIWIDHTERNIEEATILYLLLDIGLEKTCEIYSSHVDIVLDIYNDMNVKYNEKG